MNTLEEQKKLSESLLDACKVAGIEYPKYFAQDANGNVFHYSQSKPKPQKHCEEWDSLDRFIIFQMLKKLLRFGRKHKDAAQDVVDTITSAIRWLEINAPENAKSLIEAMTEKGEAK